ncbi:hypothetical protein ACK8HX_13355 [Oryzobacter sp. R7]|uniref:hypothetical protein n=1 Tax=Oryzobacter faecalis TaxID=3388656 RepID=UPI00398CF8D5
MTAAATSARRVRVASVLGCLVGAVAHLSVLLDLRWAPGRTAIELRYASNFFELQAASLLEGRLDVPEGSLGIEGFVVGGRTFMYFPPFPALVRMPVMLVTREFDGRLTVLSMALAWLVLAVVATRLVWLCRRVVHGPDRPVGRLEAALVGVVLAAMTGGTVLTFDASLPWVYHEVYTWAVATVVGALYWLARVLHEPSRRAHGWLLAFAAAAALTRTTGGLAVCGAIGLAALWRWAAGRRVRPGRAVVALLVASLVPALASVTLNLAKFDHPYLFPLREQVWTEVSEQRREALEANGGTITGPQFLPTTLPTYFGVEGIRFTPWFPWVSAPADPPPVHADAVFDQTYRTASVTATTPLLLLLAALALPLALTRRAATRAVLVPPLLGSAAVGMGVLMYGYIANRYTSEFVPFLVVGSAVTVATLAPYARRLGPVVGGLLLAGAAVLTAYSLAVHALMGLTTSAVTAGGDRLVRHLEWQRALSGGEGSAQAGLVEQVDGPPAAPGTPDTLAMTPGCGALYLATGDRYEPWVLVEERPTVLEVGLGRDIEPGTVRLASVLATSVRDVDLEVRDDHHVRVVVRDAYATVEGPWFGVYPTTTFRLAIAPRPSAQLATVTTTPGGFVAQVPYVRRDLDFNSAPGRVVVDAGAPARARALGATVVPREGRPPALCEGLARDAGVPGTEP